MFALRLATLRSEWRATGEKWVLTRSIGQRSFRKRLATEVEGAVPEDCGPDLDRLLGMHQIIVQRRLAPVGLADLCLDLFSSKVNLVGVVLPVLYWQHWP